jgi:hypothetical protein
MAGPLTLSVVTDSISTLAGALPLIAMTDALTHVDWAMLISIMSMKVRVCVHACCTIEQGMSGPYYAWGVCIALDKEDLKVCARIT